MNILVTGTAGFIGYHLAELLLEEGHQVTGLDHINDYYDINLKFNRLRNHGITLNGGNQNGDSQNGRGYRSSKYDTYKFCRVDLQDRESVFKLFEEEQFDVVVNLAAQAGVRHSLSHPQEYIDYNVTGFLSILEACRQFPVKHLIYASSSSVYGLNTKMPFSVKHNVDHPVSLYAATKKSNELMAHTYSHLYQIPATGLRFFTVYGPMGRPDMAYFSFANKYFNQEPISIYNNGDFDNDLYRDFTYIDDIVEGIERLINQPPPTEGKVPHKLFNIGNNSPEKLMHFIDSLEKALSNALGRQVEFKKKFEPIKPGDVPRTYASTEALHQAVGFKPKTSIEEGLQQLD